MPTVYAHPIFDKAIFGASVIQVYCPVAVSCLISILMRAECLTNIYLPAVWVRLCRRLWQQPDSRKVTNMQVGFCSHLYLAIFETELIPSFNSSS